MSASQRGEEGGWTGGEVWRFAVIFFTRFVLNSLCARLVKNTQINKSPSKLLNPALQHNSKVCSSSCEIKKKLTSLWPQTLNMTRLSNDSSRTNFVSFFSSNIFAAVFTVWYLYCCLTTKQIRAESDMSLSLWSSYHQPYKTKYNSFVAFGF